MQNVSTAKRPLGITIISILLFITAIIDIVGGIFGLIGTRPSGSFNDILVDYFPLIIGVIELVLAWGLWTLKPWAYWATLILEIVNIRNIAKTQRSGMKPEVLSVKSYAHGRSSVGSV